MLCIAALGTAGCGPMMFVVDLSGGDQRLKTTVVEEGEHAARNRVAVIDISGMIYNGARAGLLRQGENPVSLLHERLEMARTDPRVKAVILRLNTPGGTVTASDIMHRQVRRFRERSGKPVVALMMDVAASGGYYVACAADHIVAHPTSITGITDDHFSDATDGRVVTGDHALAWGLVDQTGDLYDAAATAKKLAGIRGADLVIYHRPLAYVGSPYARAADTSGPTTQINLAQINLHGSMGLPPGFSGAGVGIFYLWQVSP